MPAKINIRENEDEGWIRVAVGDSLLTRFLYDSDHPAIQRPICYPLMSPTGSPVTRGYPLEPREGERTDHPHHLGTFFAYGSDPGVEGVDFWNVSEPVENTGMDQYGWIRHEKHSIEGSAIEAEATWVSGDGRELLAESTRLEFAAIGQRWCIDRTTTLSAIGNRIRMHDDKEGLFAIRVARQLEHPDEDVGVPSEIIGENLTPTTERPGRIPGTGNYLSAARETGTDVWGTRARWMRLSGNLSPDEPVSVTIFDHSDNPGYPTYWHARGYGLFAANPLGQEIFSDGEQALRFAIEPNEPVTFRYRIAVEPNTPTPESLDLRQESFSQDSIEST